MDNKREKSAKTKYAWNYHNEPIILYVNFWSNVQILDSYKKFAVNMKDNINIRK